MRSLKKMRKDQKLTQQQVADMIGISLRSYISYENDLEKVGTVKYNYMVDFLSKMNNIDEEHGILELDDIRNRCSEVFAQYDVSYCYLFGSYAKSKAKPTSDIDLLISANIKGLEFFGLLEELRESLQKKIDVLDINQLKGNFGLVEEILKDGIKIYG